MDKLEIFNHPRFGSIRTIVEPDGTVLACGSDVAKALGYANTRDALSRHCRGVVKRDTTDKLGRKQEANFIPEGDIYRLTIGSELEGAQEFEHWIFDVVIPSIRKNGGYIAGQETMSDAEIMAKALLVAQKTIESKQAVIEQMQPKALFADAVETSHTSILIGDLAKLLKQNGIDIGQNRLFDRLRREGYLCNRSGDQYNAPTQRSMEMGLFEVRERTINNPDGSVRITRTTKVTGKGQIYFINRYCGKQNKFEIS